MVRVKRKGAYEYEREHHQNHSALVVPKVAEMALLQGVDIADTIRSWPDIYDFMLRVKKPALEWGGAPQQSTCRYYVSTQGHPLLERRDPPPGKRLGDYKKGVGVSDKDYHAINRSGVWDERIHTKNHSTYQNNTVDVEAGWLTTVANDIMAAVNPINYDYYIERTRKLVEPVRR